MWKVSAKGCNQVCVTCCAVVISGSKIASALEDFKALRATVIRTPFPVCFN